MTKYQVAMELAGPFAMWTRPDTGRNPTSYPVPTSSAAKGIFESVAFFNDGNAWIRPTQVQLCKPIGATGGAIHYQRYTNNYGGPLREKSKQNFQFSALVLTDVCYRLYGVIENGSGRQVKRGDNPSHALQAIFQRRLSKGQCYKTPALGWNEFVPSYWGPLRDQTYSGDDKTEVDATINLDMVSVLTQVFDDAIQGVYQPSFATGEAAIVQNGTFTYAE